MTDNEIINALENEIRSIEYVDSDYCDGVDLTLIKSALNLINRQQAEIERLKECPKCIYEYDGKTTEYCVQGPCSNLKTVEQIKSEAYKEFAERLKERSQMADCFDSYTMVVGNHFINNILNEMIDE